MTFEKTKAASITCPSHKETESNAPSLQWISVVVFQAFGPKSQLSSKGPVYRLKQTLWYQGWALGLAPLPPTPIS